MIVSFHPLFEADKNIICAGREPDSDDLAAIRAAEAVVLSQGCRQSLYEMAKNNCANVFPNYEARFNFPGKIGQIQLFRETGMAHPQADVYSSVADFKQHYGAVSEESYFTLPVVFKFDWGGQGQTVYLINSLAELKEVFRKAADYENSGQTGFLLQQYVPANGKTLRVVIIGQTMISYWRIQPNFDAFMSSVSAGARIEKTLQPELQNTAKALVEDFCRKTGINLAGFDVIFSSKAETTQPLLLEINYFFGRKGIGGSDVYYEILNKEIDNWLANAVSGQDG
jgi:ribosomal protein S6--L-glutamate ligase